MQFLRAKAVRSADPAHCELIPSLMFSQKQPDMIVLETERLLLRRWKDSDRQPFSRLNADPRVMEFMPSRLAREESDRLVEQIESHFRERGFGLYAAELRRDHSFIGFIGLAVPSFHAHFTPCVEIGWRLSADYWGQGLATEARAK